MEQICLDFPRYGYRRVTKQLQREGRIINHKKVARIMREKGWRCRPRKRKWICTTDSNHNFKVYPNLIKDRAVDGVYPNLIKDRAVDGINQLWVADITYIHILVCFVYLAVILDVYSRKAIGYALSRNLDTQLTLCAFQISMSRKGNPYDNAFAESFMKTLKSEEVHLWEYRTMEDAQRRIPYFIEDVYNHKRLHSAIGYCPPNEYEFMLESTPNPSQNTLIRAL
jgi:transposase InsO family protein